MRKLTAEKCSCSQPCSDAAALHLVSAMIMRSRLVVYLWCMHLASAFPHVVLSCLCAMPLQICAVSKHHTIRCAVLAALCYPTMRRLSSQLHWHVHSKPHGGICSTDFQPCKFVFVLTSDVSSVGRFSQIIGCVVGFVVLHRRNTLHQ